MADRTYIVEFKDTGAPRVKRNIKGIGTAGEKAAMSTKKLSDRLFSLKSAIIAVAAGLATREIIRSADAWTSLSNKIKLATDSTDELIVVRKELLDISRRTRSGVAGNITLFQRLTMANRNLGKSQKELLKFTETVSQTLAISGATAQETASTLLQLSQGLGSVAVRGEELRAVMESAPRLMKAVADATNLTVGEIKQLTAEGKFLSKDFFEAVMTQSPMIQREFAKTAATFSQVGAIFRDVFNEIVGKIGVDTGVFGDMSTGLLDIADQLRANLNIAIAGVQTVSDALKEMSADQGAGKAFIRTAQLAGDIFMQTIFAGFKLLAVVVVDLGKIMGDAIAEGIKGNAKDIVATLTRFSSIPAFAISGGFKGGTDTKPSIDIGELQANFKAITEDMKGDTMSLITEFYSEATNGSKNWGEEMQKNLEQLKGNGAAISDMKPQLEETAGFFEQFGLAFDGLNQKMLTFAEIMATTVQESIRGVSDELASLVVDGTADFKALAKSIIKDMISMMIQAQITKVVMAFAGGGIAGGVGARQFGGQVQSGQPTMVGERGPELFVPQTAGRVMNNSQSQGGGDSPNIRIVNAVSGDAVLQNSSNSVIDEVVMNSISRNSSAMRGVLA